MGYVLKEEEAEKIRSKYRNSYIAENVGLSQVYVSVILHRKRPIPKRLAYAFTKTIDSELEINDLFEFIGK